jgi:5S rRNA maturation endonuclease (ribonuclease M5)
MSPTPSKYETATMRPGDDSIYGKCVYPANLCPLYLFDAATAVGISKRIVPHQLRHTYATEMVRAGVSLPALMTLLGHVKAEMTMKYVQVAGNDLQREFHLARSQPRHLAPQPKTPAISPRAGLDGVADALLFAQHTIEMFRRSLSDGPPRRCLDRLSNRLSKILCEARKLNQAGTGYDAYVHRIVFPLEGNLYGRSLSASAPPHRFLPGTKGGLYAWERVRLYPEVVLVEGLFDYAVLWQAGYHNVTCAMGNHLNARQFRQLCDGMRIVYLVFDADSNGSGQQAAQSLACRLREQGVDVRTVSLPEGHDPNSFFVQGGDARQFQTLLEAAQ